MDRDDDGAAADRTQAVDHLDDLERLERVQPRGRLVEEDYSRLADDLHSDGGPLALSAAHALALLVADLHVASGADAQIVDESLDGRALLHQRNARRQPETCREQQRLVYGQHRIKVVVLQHVRRDAREGADLVTRHAADHELTREPKTLRRGRAISQRVDE